MARCPTRPQAIGLQPKLSFQAGPASCRYETVQKTNLVFVRAEPANDSIAQLLQNIQPQVSLSRLRLIIACASHGSAWGQGGLGSGSHLARQFGNMGPRIFDQLDHTSVKIRTSCTTDASSMISIHAPNIAQQVSAHHCQRAAMLAAS